MSGKTLIGGTEYDIKVAGKARIGGTDYTITKGKTLINGIAYDIKFPGPNLEDLLKDIEILGVGGRNDGSSQATFYVSKSSDTRTQYLISIIPTGSVGTSFGVYQIKNGSVTKEIYRSAILYNGYYNDTSNNRWYYASTTNASSASNAYGGTIALVTFPTKYSDAVIEDILLRTEPTTIAANGVATIISTPSLQTVSTTNKTHHLLMCVRANYLDFRYGDDNSYTVIKKTSTAAASVSGSGSSSTLSLGSVYVGSILYLEEHES